MNDKNPNVAANLMDLCTAKQLNMIRAVCRELNLNAENECQLKMHCGLYELSKSAASEFIQYLENWMEHAE